jgi:hypothetical protein
MKEMEEEEEEEEEEEKDADQLPHLQQPHAPACEACGQQLGPKADRCRRVTSDSGLSIDCMGQCTALDVTKGRGCAPSDYQRSDC